MRPVDVVLIAQDVIRKHQTDGGSIDVPLRVLGDGLLSTIATISDIKIEAKCLPWPGNFIFGRLNRYTDRAEILYSSSLNACWSRLVICKEAMHVMTGEDTNYSSDPVTIVTGLINEIPPGVDEEIDAEWSAVYGALELLVPTQHRDTLYAMERDGLSHYEIAYYFRVPEKLISLRLSPAVRAMLDKINDEMYMGG